MIETLKTLMGILDVRKAGLERRLGWCVSYTSRLFSGGMALRFEHVVDIGRALGLTPAEVFGFAYPERGEPPSEAGCKVRETLARLAAESAPQPPPPAEPARPALTEDDVERLIRKTLRRALGEGL
jgi:hypothetical protein